MYKDFDKEITLRNQLIDGLNREAKLKDRLIKGLENDIKIKDELINTLRLESSLKDSILEVQEKYLNSLEERIAKYEEMFDAILPTDPNQKG